MLDNAPETAGSLVKPQDQAASCGGACGPAGGAEPPAYVYSIGRLEARFPSIAVEKEFLQATARADTSGKTDQMAFHTVLSQRENRYLARQMCWVFAVQGLETYLLKPREPTELDGLIDAIRPAPSPGDVDVVIGLRGPIAPPEICNGLMVPMVLVDQLYSFDRASLVSAIPRPQGISAEDFEPASNELFDRVMRITDNAGATDEHRALNYLAMRYPAVYATVAESHGRDCSLSAVDVVPSRLTATRKIMDVIFSFTNRKTDVTDKYFTRVDVSEEFPFLVTKMSPYFNR